jgi:tRNA/tmRNA/rRNA uracil-C5-methylase (TrmA/RlmC/RlmD family)
MGEVEPYYGVKPERAYLKRNLDEQARAEFFRSGEEQLEEMLRIIQQHFDQNFSPTRALDYGCGVGRVLVPLARKVKQVVGCDVSPSMFKESKANCDRYGYLHPTSNKLRGGRRCQWIEARGGQERTSSSTHANPSQPYGDPKTSWLFFFEA